MSLDLFLDEKKFISVSRASKQIGYSQDYVGQLCRHKKVPAKLIGRTWFVDFGALSEHKKNNNYKNSKKYSNEQSNQGDFDLPRFESKPSVITPIKYETDHSELLPTLSKRPEVRHGARPLLSHNAFLLASFVVSVFILGNVTFSWLNYGSPRLAEEVKLSFAQALERVSSNFGDFVNLAQVGVSGSSVEEKSPDGLVVFPSSPDDQKKIAEIKNNFSDEVEVMFDKGGESGVIRPVFRPGDNTEDYAFVLVPIKESQ